MPEAKTAETPTADDSALSFEDGADAIADLILDPGETPDNEAKDGAHEQQAEAEADEPDEGEGAEDQADTDEQEDQPEDEDGPEVVGGRFAPDTAKIKLPDGRVTTVAALKTGSMLQSDYSRKMHDVGAKRKELDEHEATLTQVAQALKQQRDFLLQYGQRKLPQPPSRELMQSDPIGYMQAKAEYEDGIRELQQIAHQQHSETGRLTEAQKQQLQQRRTQEAERLMEVMPELKVQKTYETFWSEASSTLAEKYGYTPAELAEVATDHRLYPMMRDLVKYHKALKQAPKVKEDIQAKPKLMGAGRRMDPKAKTSREAQARRDQLRQSGSFEAGVAALMDLDL